MTSTTDQATSYQRRNPWVPLAMAGAVALVLAIGLLLLRRADAQVNHHALADAPRGVTVIEARATTFRGTRRYIGTLEPWLEARVGPEFVSAYVRDVRVRPGDVVRQGDVVATLDCRNAAASTRAIGAQARAQAARQVALAHQAERMSGLVDAGFVAANEVEQRAAESASEQARLEATRAQLQGTELAVNDCVLRAPFDGEVATRALDPGGFARPGVPLVTVVDRTTVRVATDVPETDFAAVAPGGAVRMHLLATGEDVVGVVARRSPAADPGTRTIHVEVDLPDPTRHLPVGTTAEISVEVGAAAPAVEIPATAASLRGETANVFVVSGGVAHRRRFHLVGQRGGSLFIDPSLPNGAHAVTEGRALLSDGDRVAERVEPFVSVQPGGAR